MTEVPLDRAVCIDSDALTNLLALDCLGDAISCLGCSESCCFRLPSIEAQLKRGRWVGERWPRSDRGKMAAAAGKLPVLPPPQNLALQEQLNSIAGIDEGEAYILARAMEDQSLFVLTGDGVMIRALHREPAIIDLNRLRGRIAFFPQIIEALGKRLSVSEVEYRWRQAAPGTTHQRQKSLAVIFGSAPTSTEDFWTACQFQISRVSESCGESWLYSF